MVINIKADRDVKEKAQRLARDLGLPLSTVINAYLKQFIRNKEVYFSAVPRMTSRLETIIARARKDLKNKKSISPVLATADEIAKYLSFL